MLVENCKQCKSTTKENKYFPYCCPEHWQYMVDHA